LAVYTAFAACSSNQAAAPPGPTPTVSSETPSFAASPSPVPVQRLEAPLPVPIEETAAAAAGGKLYVMGGFNAAGASLATVYVFDGKTWSSGPALPLALDHASAASLGDRVYIAGGHSNGADSARLYRLDGDHWTELAGMTFARGGHALIASVGLLVAIGGNTVRGNVAPVESYDPTTNAWTVLPNLPGPRNHVSGFVKGQFACVAGGRSPTTARVDCIAAAYPTWDKMPDLPRVTSGAGAATLPGGAIVVLGATCTSVGNLVASERGK
jgi:N-acetylneuraminic acid mutarotase